MEGVRSDIVNNLYQFVPISSKTPDLVTIIVRCQIKEEAAFRNQLVDILNADYLKLKNEKLIRLKKLEKLCDLMEDDKLFKLTYHAASGVEVTDPSLSELIKIKEIKANRHLGEHVLSEIYQKIILSQFSAIEKSNHVGVGLSGDVTEDLILKRLIKYSFSEGEDYTGCLECYSITVFILNQPEEKPLDYLCSKRP